MRVAEATSVSSTLKTEEFADYYNRFATLDFVSISFGQITPILRIFSVEKAKEFYVEYLGFQVDWEHRFEENLPLYMQVSRGTLQLHLSEHHGDGCPGANISVKSTGVEEFHRELTAKNYRYLRPGVEKTPWQTRSLQVTDPFGNRIRFEEPIT